MRNRYLFKRAGSENWYLRLDSRKLPGGKLIERSLGTSDLKAAELAAADAIKQHKAIMYQRRQARVARIVHGPWVHEFEPGLHALPEGDHVMATNTALTFTDAAGKITGTRPNGGPMIYLTGARLSPAAEFKALDDAWDGIIGPGPVPTDRPKFVAAKSSPDDDVLETYIRHRGITGTSERQARDIWRTFRTVVYKPLAKCTRDDGRVLVAYLENQAGGEIKSATLHRRLVPLVAAVNFAIGEGKLTFNPFQGCIPERDDENERAPFTDADMKIIRANLHQLDKSDQLLVRLTATTGIRRGEAFEIDSEQTENGIRFTTIGSKTPQSLRRIPFPKDLLPYLPKKITGPLFTGRMDSTGKRLKSWLHDIGITDADKAPLHSFRHRAAQRMRAAGVPEDVREAVGGWANGKKKKTSRKYGNKHGAGFPIKMLKAAIDKIGF